MDYYQRQYCTHCYDYFVYSGVEDPTQVCDCCGYCGEEFVILNSDVFYT